jgi:tripartite-type tricarboxylate transporter receptor subunit TctC
MQGARGARMRFVLAIAWAIAVLAGPAAAETDYPHRAIRIVVPFGPGGSSDVIARILSVPLQQMLGQSVVIENRGGGGSNVGTAAVARAEPDGYTLLLTTSAFVANPALYKSIPYDPIRDYEPVADLAVAPNMLVANRDTGITSLAELIARAKAAPDALNYSSAGVGTTPHMAVELLKVRAGINLTHIAYPGGGPATQAVLSGTVQLFSGSMPNVHEHAQTGTVKALGITTAARWPDLPDVPTFIEQGFPGFVTETIHVLLAPAGTPPEIVEKLAHTTLTILERPDMQARLTLAGYRTVAGGPKALAARIAREVPFYRDLATQTNIRLE